MSAGTEWLKAHDEFDQSMIEAGWERVEYGHRQFAYTRSDLPGVLTRESAFLDVTRRAVKYVIDAVMNSGMLENFNGISEVIPEDPRERALYLRKHRGTGPCRPIQEQRRRR